MNIQNKPKIFKASGLILFLAGFFCFFGVARSQTPEKVFFEAESMAHDGNWKEIYMPNESNPLASYSSNLRYLRGSDPLNNQGILTKTIDVLQAGTYRVWARYIDSAYRGPFKVEVFQDGQSLGFKVFDMEHLPNRADYGSGYSLWVWDYLDVPVSAGQLQINVTKEKLSPTASNYQVSWVGRWIDCFVVTNDFAYKPRIHDYSPPLYIKVKIGTGQTSPAVINISGSAAKDEETSGSIPRSNLTKNGIFTGGTNDNGLTPENLMYANDETEWWKISDYMGFSGPAKLNIFATDFYEYWYSRLRRLTSSDYYIYVSSTPSDDGIFKTFHRSGAGSTILVNLDLFFPEKDKTDIDYSGEAKVEADKIDVPGKRAQKFPLLTSLNLDLGQFSSETVSNEMSNLSKMGFNGLSNNYSQIPSDNGFTRPAAGSFMAWTATNGCFNDVGTGYVNASVGGVAQKAIDLGWAGVMTYFNLGDEPSSNSFAKLQSCPKTLSGFVSYIQSKGLTLGDLGKSDWGQVVFTTDKVNEPKLYYQSALYRDQVFADLYKAGTDVVKSKIPDAKTIVNHGNKQTYSGNELTCGDDWFLDYKSGATTYGWGEDWLNGSLSFQMAGYIADYLRAAYEGKFGIYDITEGKRPQDVTRKAATEIGRGAKALEFFAYGPYYAGAGDNWSTKYDLYPAVAKINKAIGAIEDYLINSTVSKSKIAILYSDTTDIWRMDIDDNGTTTEYLGEQYSIFGKEQQFLYLLFRHLGYSVDILTENDVISGKLADYQMLVVEGSHLKKDTVAPLTSWVENGGVLYLGAGSGQFNEDNQVLGLDSQIGLERSSFDYNYANNNPGVDQWNLPNLKNLDVVSSGDKSLDVLGALQKLKSIPANATIAATFSDGSPAFLSWPVGSGKVFFSGFFPGLGYGKAGVRSRACSDCNPGSYPESYRTLFSSILSGLPYKPPVTTSNYLVEANVLENPDSKVVVLSNWNEEPVSNLTVTLTTDKTISDPQIVGATLNSFSQSGNTATFNLNIDDFAFVVLPAGPPKSDLNSDTKVDTSDFDILKADFLKLAASLTNPKSDINQDGQATIKDIGIMMSQWKP